MKLIFSKHAWADYLYWQQSDKKPSNESFT
jgi:Txe/YoeB family toxin of Txe-Axe toxin-antitoxin module